MSMQSHRISDVGLSSLDVMLEDRLIDVSDRTKPDSPPALEAMRTQQRFVHQSSSITCSATMFAVYLVLCPSRTLCVTGWPACAGHPGLPTVWVLVH